MKRLLFVVLMMICSVSWAEWEFLGRAGDGEQTVYVDTSTIRKNGVISRMWELIDFSKVQTNRSGDRWMSSKSLAAYNCRDETLALISAFDYSGSMGHGNVVGTLTVQEREWKWVPIVPETIAETKWKIACGRAIIG